MDEKEWIEMQRSMYQKGKMAARILLIGFFLIPIGILFIEETPSRVIGFGIWIFVLGILASIGGNTKKEMKDAGEES